MDWSLRSCSRKGHVTYAPDEAEFRAKLEADTPLGDAWRCLRCGTYVLGDPHGSGAAQDAPVLLRGKALRSAFILRALAIERWVRGAILILLGIAVVKLKSTQVSLQDLFEKDLKSLDPFFRQIHFRVSDSTTITSIEKVLHAKASTLNYIAIGLILYGLLQVAEGIGLWSLKRWGEYVAVVGTTLFIPLEVYELTDKISWLKVVVLLVNVAAVLYLLFSKRLFGIRGGGKAYEQALHEVSLLEVEESAEDVPT
ncbi:MAG: DUF2127 domain-containing protein [Jatrophihabitantaceae bacterium]